MRTFVSSKKNNYKLLFPVLLIVLLLSAGASIWTFRHESKNASAASVADFNPGRIIDDAVFTDSTSMNASQIQAFLEAKVPVCDTNGTNGSTPTSRRDYIRSKGYDLPIICLRNYQENGKSAAQIIYDISQQYGINPQVLLVLLEKEQGLVSDDWPGPWQYKTATGYGCPDNTPGVCSNQYYGFTNQLKWSATMFRAIMNASPTWRTPYVVGNQIIYYNPGPYDNANNRYYGRFGNRPDIEYCGASEVNIENRATQALYNYTPYQPNGATLKWKLENGPAVSSGYPGCGAFGNINFFTLFTGWFGRTTLDCRPDEQPYAEIMRVYNPSNYKHFYTAYTCEVKTLTAKSGYQFEGTSFYQTNASSPYAVVVHRLYNPKTYQHLWVTTQDEINSATQKSGYVYEGVAFYAVKPEVPGSVIVHRLYNPKTYEHLWVTTQAEIDSATKYSGYVYEGPAFWSAPPPASS